MDFMSKYKALGLAVGFIMGLYLAIWCKRMSKIALALPIIGIALSSLRNLATFKIPMASVQLDISRNPLAGYAAQIFGPRDFLVALMAFMIVAFVIFLLVKVAKRSGIGITLDRITAR